MSDQSALIDKCRCLSEQARIDQQVAEVQCAMGIHDYRGEIYGYRHQPVCTHCHMAKPLSRTIVTFSQPLNGPITSTVEYE